MLNTYLILIIGLGLLGVCSLRFGSDGFKFEHILAQIVGMVACTACLLALICGAIGTYSWYSSGHKAKIINREYNTNYTQEEIFYAEDVIETIREIKRQRNEVKVEVKK